MAYQIVKGWPSEGALDEILTPAAGLEMNKGGGQLVALEADGKVVLATFDPSGADADRLAYFAIDSDSINGNVTALKSGFIVECDADHYVAGAYTPNQKVTATDGKFAPVTGTEKVVGIVSKFDAANGKMRVVWTAVA